MNSYYNDRHKGVFPIVQLQTIYAFHSNSTRQKFFDEKKSLSLNFSFFYETNEISK